VSWTATVTTTGKGRDTETTDHTDTRRGIGERMTAVHGAAVSLSRRSRLIDRTDIVKILTTGTSRENQIMTEVITVDSMIIAIGLGHHPEQVQ
jgi:hypothetical protein